MNVGYKIVSPYNHKIVLFDGCHLSKEDCDRVSQFLRDGWKANADREILLAEAREMYTKLIKKHDKLRAKYIAELCMYRYEYKEQKKLTGELISTIEDLEAGKDELEQALDEKERALAGSKRKYTELENEMERDRLAKENMIMDRQETIDYILEQKVDLEEEVESLQKQNNYLQNRIINESKANEREANATNHCIIS